MKRSRSKPGHVHSWLLWADPREVVLSTPVYQDCKGDGVPPRKCHQATRHSPK